MSNKDNDFHFRYINALMDLDRRHQQMDFTDMLSKYPTTNVDEVYEWEIIGKAAR